MNKSKKKKRLLLLGLAYLYLSMKDNISKTKLFNVTRFFSSVVTSAEIQVGSSCVEILLITAQLTI